MTQIMKTATDGNNLLRWSVLSNLWTINSASTAGDLQRTFFELAHACVVSYLAVTPKHCRRTSLHHALIWFLRRSVALSTPLSSGCLSSKKAQISCTITWCSNFMNHKITTECTRSPVTNLGWFFPSSGKIYKICHRELIRVRSTHGHDCCFLWINWWNS